MKRHIKKIVQLVIICIFAVVALTGCVDEAIEIFDNTDTPTEESKTDEEDEKKSKPGGKKKGS